MERGRRFNEARDDARNDRCACYFGPFCEAVIVDFTVVVVIIQLRFIIRLSAMCPRVPSQPHTLVGHFIIRSLVAVEKFVYFL